MLVVLNPTSDNTVGVATQSFSLQDLLAADATGGMPIGTTALAASGAVAQYHVQVSIAADAYSGQSIAISDLDLLFSGVVTK